MSRLAKLQLCSIFSTYNWIPKAAYWCMIMVSESVTLPDSSVWGEKCLSA